MTLLHSALVSLRVESMAREAPGQHVQSTTHSVVVLATTTTYCLSAWPGWRLQQRHPSNRPTDQPTHADSTDDCAEQDVYDALWRYNRAWSVVRESFRSGWLARPTGGGIQMRPVCRVVWPVRRYRSSSNTERPRVVLSSSSPSTYLHYCLFVVAAARAIRSHPRRRRLRSVGRLLVRIWN